MIDEAKLNDFMGKVLGDLGGASSVAMVRIGDDLGLYKTLQCRPADLRRVRQAPGLAERYLREWLSHQAASSYLDLRSGDRHLRPSGRAGHGVRRRGQPGLHGGRLRRRWRPCSITSPRSRQAFKTGGGVGWGDQAGCMFCAAARFFRPATRKYRAELAAGARRRRGQARARRQGRRCRLRPWLVDRADGARLSRIRSSSATTSTPDSIDGGAGACRGARRRRPMRASRWRLAKDYPGNGLRSRDLLRLPARHGRSGRRRARTCASR